MGMIKKTVILSLVLTSGCATYNPNTMQVGPWQVQPNQMIPQPIVDMSDDPGMYIVDRSQGIASAGFTQPINDPFILADQVNQLVSGIAGPNNFSGGVLQAQNYYRDGMAVINNPWNGFFALRNLWVK
jgi:hypothetical protein